ncbi:MAG TPA: PEP-CTERM sorting domain-containing protein [Caldimonas sp.]|nr:PEP-CTERM sorting domain-containing protein [Caldimonas sp.]
MTSRTSLCGRLTLACLVIASPAAHADITVFTSPATFLAAVTAPGVDTFSDFSTTTVTSSPIARAAGPYTYSASSGTGFFGAGTVANPALSTNSDFDAITFFNLSGGASAIGGNFFGTDLQGNFVASAVILTATDTLGAISTQTFVATPTSFIGFVSTGGIATLVFSTTMPGNFVFPAVDNLTIAMAQAAPIPEPQTWSLLFAGLAVIGFFARKSRPR